MSFFTDTNLPIGYTIPQDKWHDKAVEFIDNANSEIYWSTYVRDEYNHKRDSIIDNMEIFLDDVEDVLGENEKSFHALIEFEKFIFKKTIDSKTDIDKIKKNKLIEEFWTNNNFIECMSEETLIKFNEFAEEVIQVCYKRDLKLNEILLLHDCGLDNYLKYKEYAHKLCEWGVHNPDYKIVIDAHDCGTIHDDLIFVSMDGKMLETISKHDTSHLNIIEFRPFN